jgi:hypothetical protein
MERPPGRRHTDNSFIVSEIPINTAVAMALASRRPRIATRGDNLLTNFDYHWISS